jgi:Tol biopolymer transport system component
MALSPGTRLGSYQVIALIGAGGMGEVYRARDTRLNRDVALKVLPEVFARDAERMARFEREAKLLASLNHPNIAAIYGLEESSGIRALVMELVEGPTLAERIGSAPFGRPRGEQSGPSPAHRAGLRVNSVAKGPSGEGKAIPIEEALPIARQVADAVEYAHDKSVIHRDLKPANIKVTAEGTVKVLDFGLAKALADEPTEGDIGNSPTLSMNPTMAGVILGTAAYMAPEQAKGKRVDRRADVWAFGVVVYEMLTGKQLYEGETIPETLASVMKEAPALEKLPAETPPAIRNLLRRCLEKDVKRRLQNAGEARIVIEDVLSGAAPAAVEAATPIGRVARLRQGYGGQAFLGWAVAAVTLAALAALAFVHFRETPPQQASVRFEVTPPENANAQVFRLSPDGRYIVMRVPEGGRNRLWLRPLDSLQAEPLNGTDGATYPFWSPDSAFIGFFAQDKLKKIAVTGGPPQTLCDAPAARGGSWNRDGVILFAGLTSGIHRVSAAGGVATFLTHLRTDRDTDLQRFPEFLPDGQRFLYLTQTDGDDTGIYVGSLHGAASVRILPDASSAIYVPPTSPGSAGHVLFRREETLMAQPFDPDQLEMPGEMFPVAEEVRVAANVDFGAFSASDGGMLAYASATLEDDLLIWLDRAGKRLGAVGKPGAIFEAALSPDDKTVAFRLNAPPTSDIWLQDLARDVVSRFTFGPGSSTFPVWSPDGSRVVFRRNTAGGGGYSMHVKPASGAGTEELLKPPGINTRVLDWSRDGKFIAYQEEGSGTNLDLWLLPVEGERKPVPYLHTPFNENLGRFSPDGKWMAYASNESGQNQVYVQPIPATGAKRQISAAGGSNPRWRRDGKELFYVAADRKLMAVPIIMAADSFQVGAAQPLFEIPTDVTVQQPTADGQRFLATAPAEGEAAEATPITVITNWRVGVQR